VKPLIEHHLARGRIVVINQTPGVIEYDFFRNAAKMAERSLHPIKPRRLSLVTEGPDVNPPRIAKRGYEQEQAASFAADRQSKLPKINLQLLARRCLEPNGRPGFHQQFLPQMRNRALQRAQADDDPMLTL
jgi:hypothetical protein